jgi:hypothetical protein
MAQITRAAHFDSLHAEHALQVSQRADLSRTRRINFRREQMLLHRRQLRSRVCCIGKGIRANRREQRRETASAGEQKAASRQQSLPPVGELAF